MRSTLRALVAVSLFTTGCATAPEVPPTTVATPQVAVTSAPAEPPATPEAPEAPEACTRAGARLRSEKHAAKALTPPQEKQIAESEAFVRDHPSPSASREKAEYARARVFFEANRWTESAVAFREIAMHHVDAEVGIHASMLYVESINVLGSDAEPARPVCFEEMARDVPVLMAIYCASGKVGDHGASCSSLRHIQRDMEPHQGDGPVSTADRGGEDAMKLYEQAGVAYLESARRCVDEALRFGSRPEAEGCDAIAYDASKAFIAAGKPERAREAAKIVLDPRNGMQSTPLAAKLAKTLPATR